ncbi:uncharacterized protein LOC123516447 isoform X2 [Portunus trituberculatus]|uniref:uncharacterized protein LOC123516447 isoform X2 n=1 Tax=Portunus trituberculatus TaxID=210409 RepID=UPI001E1CF46A|nr:uncharacterized protein LOC123516447 isoform X2 [Portunus trituberculatus]
MEDNDVSDTMDVVVTKTNQSPAVVKIDVPYSSQREAEVVRNSLQVDKEPKRSESSKVFSIKENVLSVEIRSPDVRQLRTAVSSFMDLLHLATKTVNQFGPPVQQSKKK